MFTRLLFKSNARRLPGVLLFTLLFGCAGTPQTQQLLQQPPEHLRHKAELAEVAFFPQREYQCGPSALATLLDYQKIKIKPADLTDKVYTPKRKGSLQLEMVATARSYGLLTYKLAPQLSVLLAEINNGNPVLVFQNLSFELWPQWHYAVVIGYDQDNRELILRSGTVRRHTVGFSTFERTWQRVDHWAYVLMTPGKIPYTANPLDYTQASHDLQQSGFEEQALKAFRQGAKRWPDDSIALIALGNAEFSAGNLADSTRAFEHELQQHTGNHLAWNNLAYVLAARNCKKEALKAVSCALRLSPEDPNIQQSMVEIEQMPESDSGACNEIHCPIIDQ